MTSLIDVALIVVIAACFTTALVASLIARWGKATHSLSVAGYVASVIGLLLTSAHLYLAGYSGWWVVLLIAVFFALAVRRRQ